MRDFRIAPIPGRVAALVSGGLDSSVMLALIARRRLRVYPLYVRAGLVWEAAELATLKEFIRSLHNSRIAQVTVLDLPITDLMARDWIVTGHGVPGLRAPVESNYIVGRNLSLLTKASIFCARERIGAIAIGSLGANPFPDARPEFFGAVERAVALGTGLRLRIKAPLANLSKAEVIRRGRGLALELTLTCARPIRGGRHCGACTKCAERMQAFSAAGVPDPTRYAGRAG